MGIGKRVIGDKAYGKQRQQQQTKEARGGLGWRIGRPDDRPDATAETPPRPTVAAPPTGEAYSAAEAVAKAKVNPFDLLRLLDVELARADGARKTVLIAYEKQLNGMETTEANVAALAKIAVAYEAYARSLEVVVPEPEEEQPKGGDVDVPPEALEQALETPPAPTPDEPESPPA